MTSAADRRRRSLSDNGETEGVSRAQTCHRRASHRCPLEVGPNLAEMISDTTRLFREKRGEMLFEMMQKSQVDGNAIGKGCGESGRKDEEGHGRPRDASTLNFNELLIRLTRHCFFHARQADAA